MKAYLVGMIKVTNMDGMGPYAAVEDTITEHGGKFLMRHMDEKLHSKMTLIPLLW